MNKCSLAIIAILVFAFSVNLRSQTKPIKMHPYPDSKKEAVYDSYFGTKVADPYRWLEDDTSPATEAWVKAQNVVTNGYLNQIPFRAAIKERLTQIWDYPKYGSPFKEGGYYFFFKNSGLQNQSVLYRQQGLAGEPEVFLDPNSFSADGTVALGDISFSTDSRYMAYSTSASGSDWVEIHVVEVATKKVLTDRVGWVKFSGAVWKGDGFFYSRYDEPVKGKEFSNANEFQKVYFHKLGDPQAADVLVYQDLDHPKRYFSPQVTEDERFLFIYGSEGTHGTEVFWKDLTKGGDFKLLFPGFEHDYSIVDNEGDKLIVVTNNGAPNFKAVLVDPNNPQEQSWQPFIPQAADLLEGVTTGGGKLFASYLKDASTHVFEYSRQAVLLKEIALPGIGTTGGFSGKKSDDLLFYTFTSFTTPTTIFKYDVKSGESSVFRTTEVAFNPADFETHQVFFTSKDGTKVPMFIIHKKGVTLDGSNPTLLYGYGGFNISLTPSFSPSRIVFLENGGVYVMVNLRGGGEYGEAWHKAGMLDKKQNVFDDFIGAAEYLIAKKYTSSDRLAIAGGSNGGLLIGAVMTQRPELFKVAFPQVGVLDMLRYHKFTIGWGWAVEYGSSDSKEQFEYLYRYSPLHNVVKGVTYPATLIMTADHDDRVVPAHSFKFAATLQEKDSGTHPILIRIETKAGHGAGKPTSKVIDEAADMWSFLFKNVGVYPTFGK